VSYLYYFDNKKVNDVGKYTYPKKKHPTTF